MKDADWFPETVVRKAEDDTPRKGSKYGVIPLPPASVETTPKPMPVFFTTPPTGREPGKPWIARDGTLVVPMDALPRYRWWDGGITLQAIIAETAGLACPVDYTRISGFSDQ